MSLGGGLQEAQALGGGGVPEVRHIMRAGPWLSSARALATKAQPDCTIRGEVAG